jgi:hypothetical protein
MSLNVPVWKVAKPILEAKVHFEVSYDVRLLEMLKDQRFFYRSIFLVYPKARKPDVPYHKKSWEKVKLDMEALANIFRWEGKEVARLVLDQASLYYSFVLHFWGTLKMPRGERCEPTPVLKMHFIDGAYMTQMRVEELRWGSDLLEFEYVESEPMSPHQEETENHQVIDDFLAENLTYFENFTPISDLYFE